MQLSICWLYNNDMCCNIDDWEKKITKSYCSLYLLPIKEASIDRACLFLAAYKNKGQGHLSQNQKLPKILQWNFDNP